MSVMPPRVRAQRLERAARLARTPRPKSDPLVGRLPDPRSARAEYLDELRERMRKAVADYAAAEARLGVLAEWYVGQEDGAHEMYIAMEGDLEAKRLRSRRGSARERARTLALVILAEK